jgi:nucleoside-diphosphate-sugar epimerase
MTILVVRATGATGRLLVQALLDRDQPVRAVVRSPEKLPPALRDHRQLTIVHATLLDLGDEELMRLVGDCHAVASCLGHSLSLQGIYGSPQRLVTDATRRLCEAIRAARPQRPVRFVLMNTAGVRNRGLAEPVSFGQRCVIGLIRLLLPPHADNENAAEYLRTQVGRNDGALEWPT